MFSAASIQYEDRTLAPYSCPDCRVAADREASRVATDIQSRSSRENRIMELLAATGDFNPFEHGRATIENYRTSGDGKALEAAREFVDRVLGPIDKYEPVLGLYLCGPPGTGKTHLAVAIARALLLDPRCPEKGILFDHSTMLITTIQDCYSTGTPVMSVIKPRVSARVWILDDLGTEKPSEDVVRHLTTMFTRRTGMPTIVTSNLSVAELYDRNTGFFRVESRLGPMNYRHFQLKGADARYASNGDRP